METNGFFGLIYRLSDWVFRLAYLNVLWILFTVLGLILFGFYPATAGLFAVIRKWKMEEDEVPIFKTFWKTYRQEFIRVNLLGGAVTIVGIILYFDLKFFQSQTGLLFTVLYFFNWALMLIYLFMLVYFFPVFVHYELKTAHYLKQTFLIAVSRPISAVIMLVCMAALYLLWKLIPGLVIFYGASLAAYLLLWISVHTFKLIEQNAGFFSFSLKKDEEEGRS